VPSDGYSQSDPAINAPYRESIQITPSDTEDLPWITRAIIVDQNKQSPTIDHGHVRILLADDTSPVDMALKSGVLAPLRVKRVYSTETDASRIVGLR
jgi:hypothetical protein